MGQTTAKHSNALSTTQTRVPSIGGAIGGASNGGCKHTKEAAEVIKALMQATRKQIQNQLFDKNLWSGTDSATRKAREQNQKQRTDRFRRVHWRRIRCSNEIHRRGGGRICVCVCCDVERSEEREKQKGKKRPYPSQAPREPMLQKPSRSEDRTQ